jgi:hypothetical protein
VSLTIALVGLAVLIELSIIARKLERICKLLEKRPDAAVCEEAGCLAKGPHGHVSGLAVAGGAE